MSNTRMFLVSFIAVAAWAVSTTVALSADPREKLETAIPEGIRLLEAKDYATFLKAFVKPDDFKRLTERMSLEEFAKQFGAEKAAPLLKVLKSIKDAKPELDTAGTNATYALQEELGGKKTITFVKVDKYWYIQN